MRHAPTLIAFTVAVLGALVLCAASTDREPPLAAADARGVAL